MSLWKSLGKFFGGLLFTFCLVGAILAMVLVDFSSYDNVKSVVRVVFDEQFGSLITQDDMEQLKLFLAFQCSGKPAVSVPFYQDLDPITLKCDEVAGADSDKLKGLILDSVVDSVYYKKFDCEFVDCLKSGRQQDFLIAFSDEGNKFYNSVQILLWVGAAIGLAIMLVSIDTWSGRLKSVGFSLAITGLPFLFVDQLRSMLPPIPPEVQGTIMEVIDGLISSLSTKFVIMLAVGVALLIAGFGLEFYLKSKGAGPKKK